MKCLFRVKTRKYTVVNEHTIVNEGVHQVNRHFPCLHESSNGYHSLLACHRPPVYSSGREKVIKITAIVFRENATKAGPVSCRGKNQPSSHRSIRQSNNKIGRQIKQSLHLRDNLLRDNKSFFMFTGVRPTSMPQNKYLRPSFAMQT